MTKTPLIPSALLDRPGQLEISPGILSGGHVFLTGMTGSSADGSMPDDPQVQFRNAFAKIAEVLGEADLTLDSIVEMTTYHVGMEDHFDQFDRVRLDVLNPPYPAWTAVEVAGLPRKGALVEIRVIASVEG
jgi:enamine deaminase RidA (YjgF/YER057c/UK114 family)